jgi:hypothetical protein
MNWKEERDSLIAQTMAFVQSVNGRQGEAGRWDAAFAAAPRPAPILPILELPVLEPAPRALSPLGPVKVAERPSPLPGKPAPVPRPVVPSEMVNEIRARIAGFRAHQERFNREREEYFSRTLARLKASLDERPPPAGPLK